MDQQTPDMPVYSQVLSEKMVTCFRGRGIDEYAGTLGITRDDLLAKLKPKSPDKHVVVDLGSGKGVFEKEVDALHIPGLTCIGVDMFPAHEGNSIQAEFSSLPLADQTVDTVFGVATVGMYAEDASHLAANFDETK